MRDWSDYGMHNYVGEWKDDEMNGRGIMTMADGSYYRGEWRDGQKEGKGESYKASDGTVT